MTYSLLIHTLILLETKQVWAIYFGLYIVYMMDMSIDIDSVSTRNEYKRASRLAEYYTRTYVP